MNNIIVFVIGICIGLIIEYFIRKYIDKVKNNFDSSPKPFIKNGFNKQAEIDKISNLIVDMALKGANVDEITRAVNHSKVIIDAEKYNLDWQKSEKDNNIKELIIKYSN